MNAVKRMSAILYLSQLANLEKKMRWVRFYRQSVLFRRLQGRSKIARSVSNTEMKIIIKQQGMGLEICSQSRFFRERLSDCSERLLDLILSVLVVVDMLMASLDNQWELDFFQLLLPQQTCQFLGIGNQSASFFIKH